MKNLLSHPLVIFIGVPLVIALCVVAQHLLALTRDINGYIPLFAAGVLALLIVAPKAGIDQRTTQSPSLDFARGIRLIIGLIIFIIGVVLVIASAIEFHTQLSGYYIGDDAPWKLFAVGFAVALLGGLILVKIGRIPRIDLTVLLLVGIVAAAMFVRVYQSDILPFGIWYDEGIYGLQVHLFLQNPLFRPTFAENLSFPHLFAYVASYQAFGGTPNIVSMRFVTAVLASLGVIGAYLVGRELRGAWFGIAMALLLAFLRWSINFSRIAMTGPESVTMTLFAFYFVLRLVRYGRARDALWFGIVAGAGFYFYRPYQVQLAAMAVFLLFAYPFARRGLKTLSLIVVALIALVITLLPLAIFAIDQPEWYFNRLNQVSIFTEDLPESIGGVQGALVQNTFRHLEMFHLVGDRNGRHNLPNAPMLDPVSGALMIIGMFVALRELLFKRRWEHLFFYLSLAVALLGGILSVSFEAPQALRTIVSIVGVIYFAALGLEASMRLIIAWVGVLPVLRVGIIPRAVAGVGALAAIGLFAAWNIDVYFNQQRTNLESWRSYSTTETIVGQFYNDYSEDTRFFVSPLIGNGPSTQFLAEAQISRSSTLSMPDPFPLRIPADRSVAIMTIPYENFYDNYIRAVYPGADFKFIRPVDYGVLTSPDEQLFTVVELSPEDIGAIQGLENGQGVLWAPMHADYIFDIQDGAEISIDGQVIPLETAVRLAQGNHAIRVNPPEAAASMTWLYPQVTQSEIVPRHFLYHGGVTPNGLHAAFYNNADWNGNPVSTSILPLVYWQIHIIPMTRPYSVRYTGYFYAPSTGDYRFSLQAIDRAYLRLDGEEVIPLTDVARAHELNIRLEQGWHPIEIGHQDITSSTRVFFMWVVPGTEGFSPVPRTMFCPYEGICAIPDSP